ncbi:MAG: HEAT repeat domain-containing protein [Polyangiaceae bacterium]|nr:HEAT repeat domain-containing protein [Myxococcales bacterium]MCB9584745.1 HEAT repeat domain-containing protein [Polyangiaceae bacterium]MCB9607682.1 HEAT repeat domain-containing protein [Polyangiaceae bacterium]
MSRIGFLRSIASGSSIAVFLLAFGCNESKSTDAAPSASASAVALTGVQAWLADESKPLTADVYEQFVLDLSKCELNERGIDPRCEAYRDLKKARSRNTSLKDIAGLNAAVGKKLITHESPAVRWQAAQLLKSVFGSTPAVQELVLKAAEKEKEPAVLISLVRVVGSQHRDNAKIKELLLKLADHDSEHVRQEAMSWFLTPFGKGVEGTFEKVLEHVENDKSMNVRRFLCGRLYGSEDERAVPVFEKYLNEKETDPKLYEGCWQGVISAWTGFPKPENPSKKAYELTLKVLEKKPRTRTSPPWTSFRNLRAAKADFPERDKTSQAWLEKVKPWYKVDRLLKALDSIAVDREAYWMTRTAALDVMRDLGVDQKKFEALEKKYEKAENDDVHVKRKIQEILRRMQSPVDDKAGHWVGRPGGPPPDGRMPPGTRGPHADDPAPDGPNPRGNPHARPNPHAPANPHAPPQ